ncbi:MAG: hypothetical protein ABL964_06735 [Steroidobacteraceae bacterium]
MSLRPIACSALAAAALLLSQAGLAGAPPAPPPEAQKAALIDLTGNWVSVTGQDWRYRMITPAKGDYRGVPLNAAGRKIADEFDPAKYGGDKYQTSAIIDCRAYGGASLLRMPTRLRINWADANTLKIESDWGEQTRMLNFIPNRPFADGYQPLPMQAQAAAAGKTPSLQGYSVAFWEQPYRYTASAFDRGPRGGGGLGALTAGAQQPGGNLAVVTTALTPGWLRRNGVPYSEKTTVTERFQTFTDPTGAQWINVTIEVYDPVYLTTPFITTGDFMKEPDGAKWAPHSCKAA